MDDNHKDKFNAMKAEFSKLEASDLSADELRALERVLLIRRAGGRPMVRNLSKKA